MAFVPISATIEELKDILFTGGLYGVHATFPNVAIYAMSLSGDPWAHHKDMIGYQTSSGILVPHDMICRIRPRNPVMPIALRRPKALGVWNLPQHLNPLRLGMKGKTLE